MRNATLAIIAPQHQNDNRYNQNLKEFFHYFAIEPIAGSE